MDEAAPGPAILRRLPWSLLLLLAAFAAPPALAQELSFLVNLFQTVHSVTIYTQGGGLVDPSLAPEDAFFGLRGVGAEIYFDLPHPAGRAYELELALGTSFVRGFEAPAALGMDLRGSLRAFPTISFYGTRKGVLRASWLEPYVGLTFGMVDLWNAAAYDALNRKYSLNGQTYEYGAALGLAFGPGPFVEVAYRRRQFGSLDYAFPPDASELPAGWLRDLDLSGWLLSAGWQFAITDGEPDAPPAALPALGGDWVLARVDAVPLPAPVAQTEADTVRTRDELVGGRLRLDEAAGTYTLVLHRRTTTLDAAGALRTLTHPEPLAEQGRLVAADGGLALQPAGDESPVPAWRDGGELMVRMPRTHAVLAFRRAAP